MKDLKSVMTASISEVLETMFYMPLEFDDYGGIDHQGRLDIPDLRICKLEFRGKLAGHFIMAIPESLLFSMACDFMGEDREDITRQHSDGILKEALNMVAGHMFSNMDSKSEYTLGIPEIIEKKTIAELLGQEPDNKEMVLAESIEGFVLCAICLES